jgi:beta-xylosidase
MQNKHRVASLLKIVTCATLVLGAAVQSQAEDKKVDPTGNWMWTTPGRNGGPDRTNTAKLKLEGEKVTETITSPARGGQTADTTIEEGKLTGDEISFKATRELGGNKLTFKYSGKVSTDTIKGKVDFERDGQPVSRDWEAKRQAEKK